MTAFKARTRQAYLTVAASGPQAESALGRLPVRARMAAALRWTTADADLLERFWQAEDRFDAGKIREYFRLSEPSVASFLAGLRQAVEWLAQFRSAPDWDGGALNLNFAGHGRLGDGALYLSDGLIDPGSLLYELAHAQRDLLAGSRRLRVGLCLDSCHSGSFLVDFVVGASRDFSDCLYPYASGAACMPDEVAWEADRLGHGVWSYSFTLESGSEGSSMPSIDLRPIGLQSRLTGSNACVFLTGGRQTPLVYWETGHFHGNVELPDDHDAEQVKRELLRLRDEAREDVLALGHFFEPGPSLEPDIDRFVAEANSDHQDIR